MYLAKRLVQHKLPKPVLDSSQQLRKGGEKTVIMELIKDGKRAKSNDENASTLLQQFQSVWSQKTSFIDIESGPNECSVCSPEFTLQELRRVKTNTATGPDAISPRLLRSCSLFDIIFVELWSNSI
jgi:hypothetical protein